MNNNWPPSNYPIFLALVLLAATAVTLAMGDEPQAEELAIYAYYFLVIGVGIRFFELALPENSINRLTSAYVFVTESIKKHSYIIINCLANIIMNISSKLNIKFPFNDRINITKYFDNHSYISRLQQKIKSSLNFFNTKLCSFAALRENILRNYLIFFCALGVNVNTALTGR